MMSSPLLRLGLVLYLAVVLPAAAFTTAVAPPHHLEERGGGAGYLPVAKRRGGNGSSGTLRRRSWVATVSSGLVATRNGSDEKDDETRDKEPSPIPGGVDNEIKATTTTNVDVVEEELDRLQGKIHYIDALELRNEAQLGSFVDREDQWESMDEDERALLESKDSILLRMEFLQKERNL